MWDLPIGHLSPFYFKVSTHDKVWFFLLTILQTILVSNIFSTFAMCLAKLSLLSLYLRLFFVRKFMRYLIYLGMAFNFCLSIALLITFLWYCSPRSGAAWDLKLGLQCDGMLPILVILGSFNIALDLYILLLPLSTVLKLQLRLRKKIGVTIVFMTGLM